MSYEALMMYCYVLSVILSCVLSAAITAAIYRLTREKREPRLSIIAEVCEETPRTPQQDKLFTDLINGKFDIKG